MSGEDDPGREIFGYTQHLAVPVWVDKNAYSSCHHCEIKFSSMKESTKQHHCRLCGHMYCGSCTAKYHVPIVYELKGKKGPVRVCISCRDSCLNIRDKEKTAAAGPVRLAVLSNQDLTRTGPISPSERKAPQLLNGAAPIEITPPEWDDETKFIECGKCHKKGGKPHNCRACGHLFCDTCTSKMPVPPCFERKKKVGPARVCGECRFKILAGAKLVERLSTDLPELGDESAGVAGANGGSGSTTICIVVGCGLPRVSKNGYCAAHVNELGSSDADLAASASITIRWEGESTVLTRVALLGKDMTLTTIDLAFKKQLPAFAQKKDFEYMYKSEGIDPVFFDVFTAAPFVARGNSLYIRKKVDTDLLIAAYSKQGVKGRATATQSRIGGGGEGSSSGHSNPFRRRQEEEKKAQEQKKFVPPPKKEVVRVFRKPTAGSAVVKMPGASSSAPPTKKLPPPMSGQGGGAGPPPLPGGAPAGTEVYRARTKQYFGAL